MQLTCLSRFREATQTIPDAQVGKARSSQSLMNE